MHIKQIYRIRCVNKLKVALGPNVRMIVIVGQTIKKYVIKATHEIGIPHECILTSPKGHTIVRIKCERTTTKFRQHK